jgi:serine/threonine-protein kinase
MSVPLRFGPFILESRIAVGGTAEVYMARPATPDSGLPERLVVKRLLPHFASDPEGRTMFDREARLHAAVSHPNVVTVFHAGVDARSEPYLAMEFIEGVDGYRLLRRLRQDSERLPVGVAVYVAREVLCALESVHAARDPLIGGALGIVHRDVSPSNIYLSKYGKVKLGDFGIARSTTRTTLRSEQGQVLKGKFAYMAPEQVAGEPSDQRADLFSLGTVLAEILLNRPLFQGGGQLAILLAIRDCRIDALEEVRTRLPEGLFEVLSRALAREPADRYPDASTFAKALEPYEAEPRLAARELGSRVLRVLAVGSTDQLAAVRESARALRSAPPTHAAARSTSSAGPAPLASRPPIVRDSSTAMFAVERPNDESKTEEYVLLPSYVLKDGQQLGPWAFARLMEALATGQVVRGDKVDFVGRGFREVEDIEEFQRFFPATTAVSGQIVGPAPPDFNDRLGDVSMLRTLMRILAKQETGVLFATHADDPEGDGARKELYFVSGKLHHVASSNASELLGEYLVRRGKLVREELDLALAVLPRYGGRIGDTLISMGLVGPVDIFRAIRGQGRDRVADLFLWKSGTVTFYAGQSAPQVEFPLDLDLPTLMLAGLEAQKPGDGPLEEMRAELDRDVCVSFTLSEDARRLDNVVWPSVVTRVQALVAERTKVRDVLKAAAKSGSLSAGDVLRGLELLRVAGLVQWA